MAVVGWGSAFGRVCGEGAEFPCPTGGIKGGVVEAARGATAGAGSGDTKDAARTRSRRRRSSSIRAACLARIEALVASIALIRLL